MNINHTSSNQLQLQPQSIVLNIEKNGVAYLALNRAEKHNAFDSNIIAELIEQLTILNNNPNIRALVLQANGKHFSAGADLQWMRSMTDKTPEENQEDAERLAQLMHRLDTFPHPTLCLVQGCAFGGALGLICCCDMAIASPDSQFCLSEVKLGLIPATIGPYVTRAIGIRQARRYMLTAEIIESQVALNLGLIHISTTNIDQARDEWLQHILANAPIALSAAKSLCQACDAEHIDEHLRQTTSEMIATLRVSPEGQEGISAFFEKRPPNWQPKPSQKNEDKHNE
ncbi:enoyl-CoA hydratase-related protein [Photobacterium sanguinicancri]|uniref:enoyl-CoA hydratase-related protein n=1 Tax=Photobacterium sanguinicancri TaxID=875932 RepID=UPI0021C2DF5A|nr:enoyl-CoA hydratase-related protein [Photobacterium sanguinicancri]